MAMSKEFIGASKVYDHGQVTPPQELRDALGNPDDVAWWLDRETGEVILTPLSEVDLK